MNVAKSQFYTFEQTAENEKNVGNFQVFQICFPIIASGHFVVDLIC